MTTLDLPHQARLQCPTCDADTVVLHYAVQCCTCERCTHSRLDPVPEIDGWEAEGCRHAEWVAERHVSTYPSDLVADALHGYT